MVPRGQDRPRILVERNRMENRHTNTQRNLQFDEGCSGDFEETSPTFPAPEGRSNPRPSGRTPSLSTPQHTPLSRSAFDTERQLLQLQRQITTLTEKIDSLRETASSATHQRKPSQGHGGKNHFH